MTTSWGPTSELWGTLCEISAPAIERHVRTIAAFGPRPDGSAPCQAAGRYIERVFRQTGLPIQRLLLSFTVLDDTKTQVIVSSPTAEAFACHGHLRTGLTPSDGLAAPLVYLRKAFAEDFQHTDVNGKIVLAFEDVPFEGPGPAGIRYLGERVTDAYAAGAVGLIFADYRPDDLIMTWGVLRGLAPIPCLAVSYPSFCRLRHLAESANPLVQLISTATLRDATSDVISAGPEGPGDRPAVMLIGTHYETVPTSPGANDNASSLAIMLELARVLSKRTWPFDLIYVATVGEEAGSFGAIDYVRQHEVWLARRAMAAIAFDQVGGNDVPLSAHGTPALNDLMLGAASRLGFKLRLDSDPDWPRRTGLSDIRPFFDLGIPSVYLGGWTSDQYYHTMADTFDKVNPNALKALAHVIAATVWALAEKAEPGQGVPG